MPHTSKGTSSSSPAPRQATDPTTVDRLMRAAAQAFAEKGFHATTTRDIASGAGLSPAGVYVHFGSKEDLLFNLSRSGHQSALNLLRVALEGIEHPAERLAVAMNRFSAWHAEQYQLAKVVQYEHQHLTPEHRAEVLALRKDIDAVLREVLECGVADGVFEVVDISDTALALSSMAVDVARWYSPAIKRTPAEIGATNAALALRLVGSRP